LLAACGDREVWILDVLPRYLIVHCCDNLTHCVNVRRDGKSRTDACKKILTDLAELNALLAAQLTSGNVKMIATGDNLTGIKNATSGQLMDCMYSSWNTDPVHGEKVAYTRIGLGLLDIARKDPPREEASSSNRKRGREDSPGRSSGSGGGGGGGGPSGSGRGRSEDRSRSNYRRADHTTSSYQAGRDGSAYTVYPGDFDRRRGSPPGRLGGRGRYY
jgi:hypothetical protein